MRARRNACFGGAFLGAWALFALAGVAWAQAEPEPAEAPAATRDAAFRRIPFHELLGVAETPALAFQVEVPAHYRERRSPVSTSGSLLWAAPADWSLIRQGRAATGHHGMLVVERSASLRYDPDRGEFRDGTGLSESNLPERLGRHGSSETEVRRLDRAGLPILLLQSRLKRGERVRVLYVHLGPRTCTVTYIGRVPWGESDDAAWARLRDSIVRVP
jgi:hypothetical protein